MRKAKLSIVAIAVAILLVSVSAQTQTPVSGIWRDISPTAYINPPANPPLTSIYMLSANEGWAVGHYSITSDGIHAFPAVLHYVDSAWNLVPVPKNPTDPNIVAGYVLASVSFGPPDHPYSRDDGWAVGFGFDVVAPCGTPLTCGLAFHWDGVTWRDHLEGLSGANAGPLRSVSMVSPTDVWAVGSDMAGANGVFWHWAGIPGLGGGWSFQGIAPGTPLFSVFMVSSTEGWAVGASAVIYHYFGGAWTPFPGPLPAPVTLESVFMNSPTDGWAVGTGGNIIHYTAGTWTGPVSPGTTTNTLRSVFMVSSTEGWTVGDAGTLIHFSGGSWTALPTNQVPTLPATAFGFNSVYYNTPSDGWVVGTNGVILHFDGANWGTVSSPTLTELTSISFGSPLTSTMNPNDGWAVGRATASLLIPPAVTEPTIIHWNGFMWTKGVAIGTTNDLFSVFMVSTGDVWAVGGGGRDGGDTTATCSAKPCPIILHFNGGTWNTITPPSGSYVLNFVFMVNANEGWAVGCQTDGLPNHINECSPNPAPGLPNPGLRAVGGSGIILHYTITGGVGTWAIFPAPRTPTPLPPLNSVFMLSPNEGWAVGDSATVLHYTVVGGVGTWNAISVSGLPAAPPANLNSVFMLSPTSGWAVGGIPTGGTPTGPVIIYWDGTHWTLVATPTIPGSPLATPPTLKSIYCTGANDCWAVGNVFPTQLVATLFHWDGTSWTHITLAPSLLGLPIIPPILNSVFMLSPSSGWIVGSPALPPLIPPQELSTILRFTPFSGVITNSATTTLISTVTSSISYLTASTTSTSTIITSITNTNNPITTPSSPGGNIIIVIVGVVVALAVGVVLVLLLIGRKRPSARPRPIVYYPPRSL